MANAKRRLKAPKNTLKTRSKRKQADDRTNKTYKSLKNMITIQSSNDIDDSVVAKRKKVDSDLLFLTPDKGNVLKKGQQLKDSFQVKDPVIDDRPKRSFKKSTSPKSPAKCEISSPMKTKSGRLKKTNNKYLKLMDNILKSELCVIPGSKRKRSSNSKESSSNKVNNNNNSEITNQNPDCSNNKNNSLSASSTSTNVLNHTTESLQDKPISKSISKPCGRARKTSQSTTKSKEVTLAKIVVAEATFECDHCKKIYSKKHSLTRHIIYKHLARKQYSCPACKKKFHVRKNMKNHLDKEHSFKKVDDTTKMYSCDICDKAFLTKENLILHLNSHANGENSFKCIYCDQKFAYQLLLVQHEKKHLVTGKYQCTICDVKYTNRDKLYVHVKSHLKLTDYICQYCGREFLRLNSMKRHVRTMHSGHTIQCPICNKKLKGHLTEHMRTHDQKRPHKCLDCGKHFAQSTQLKVHARGHTGYRPYKCRICERPFTHSNALMLHVRRHTGEKPFPCAECPMSFSQLPHMKAHMFKIHGKENPYKCLLCCQYYKLKKDLLVHKKNCNGTGIDTDIYGDRRIYGDCDLLPKESTMSLSRMRFLLALLLTMVATKAKLKYLGFNKRLVDDLLVESLEAMDQAPCKDSTLSTLVRLRTNIETLLNGTVPKEQMEKFRKENKSTEELLELLTSDKDE